VRFACPAGHIIATQAAGGQRIKCSGCLAESGKAVLVEVPVRRGERLRQPTRPPESASAPDATANCQTCGMSAPGALPPGWLVFLAGADPAATRNGKPFRRLGPWCSARCAAAGLHGATMTAGVRPGPRSNGPDNAGLARLMTQPPRGRA
jgi:hypothetical protein